MPTLDLGRERGGAPGADDDDGGDDGPRVIARLLGAAHALVYLS